MASVDASIPLGVQQFNPMTNLSSLMGIAAQQQSIRNMQTSQQGQQIANTGNQMSLNERQAVAQLDPASFTDPTTGDLDMDRYVPAAMKAAPTLWPEYVTNAMRAQQAHTQAQQSIGQLSDENRSRVASVLAGMNADSGQDVNAKTLDTLVGLYPNIAPAVSLAKQALSQAYASGDKTKVEQQLQTFARMTLPLKTQQEMNSPNPTFVNTQAGIQPYNTKAGVPGTPVGPMGSPMIPPNQTVPTVGGGIAIANPTTGQIGGFAGQPGSTPQVDLPPGESKDTQAAAQALRQRSNAAAATVPNTQFNSNQIIKYADEADVGKGAKYIQSIGSIPGISDLTDKGTNLHVIQHYLTLQQSGLAQQAGLSNTNAQTELAGSLSGTAEGTPEAVKSISRVNRALSTGVALFNNGVEEAFKRGGPFAVRDFQNQWSSVADVNAMRLYDAKKNALDDPEGYKQVVQQLGGAGSPKFKATLAAVDKMRAAMLGQ